uniref:Protein kinase domain-containing protein n=1 Tax=Moniliophthora roreri TaxID=221103 RepID=A0A0W0F072_MONRR
MFSAGMVHRDISTGNLLVSEVDGELRCKITDLEYAKKVGESSRSPQDVKTGTPFFMALEIEAGNYLFSSQKETFPESEILLDPSNLLRSVLANESTRDKTDTPSLVRYNYLHDLESLFWILMYFLFIMHPEDDELDEAIISHRMRKFRKLFPSSLGFEDFPYNGARIEFLRGNAGVQLEFASSVPERFRVTLQFATFIAKFLKKEYERVEASSQLTTDKYSSEPYKLLHSYLDVLASAKEGVWLGKVVEIPEKLVGGTNGSEQSTANAKRKAEELLSIKEGKRSRQG